MAAQLIKAVLFVLLAAYLAGCAPGAPLSPLSQVPADYVSPDAAARILTSPANQAGQAEHFLKLRFLPWTSSEVRYPAEKVFWGPAVYGRRQLYGPNLQPLPKKRFSDMVAAMRMDEYPSLNRRAVTVAPVSVRVFPSGDPLFYDPARAGEGFPFDYNQNTLLWPGTPVRITHATAAGDWFLVETAHVYGWVRARDVGLVDEAAAAKMQNATLFGVIRDGVPIHARNGRFLARARIGMLLAGEKEGGEKDVEVVVPVRDAGGKAVFVSGRITASAVALFPLPALSDLVADVAGELMGQPYGWGGLYGYRDCSAMLKDLMAPFGLSLPRNSRQQSGVGRVVSLMGMSREEKLARLDGQGIPFATFLYRPGHILLWLGRSRERPAALHTIWGLRTRDPRTGREGRHVIGRTVITTLTPEKGVPGTDEDAMLLDRLTGMSFPWEREEGGICEPGPL
jgi:cell wall-associated NlpC family hydrolase